MFFVGIMKPNEVLKSSPNFGLFVEKKYCVCLYLNLEKICQKPLLDENKIKL